MRVTSRDACALLDGRLFSEARGRPRYETFGERAEATLRVIMHDHPAVGVTLELEVRRLRFREQLAYLGVNDAVQAEEEGTRRRVWRKDNPVLPVAIWFDCAGKSGGAEQTRELGQC